jgi:hypothetical protein
MRGRPAPGSRCTRHDLDHAAGDLVPRGEWKPDATVLPKELAGMAGDLGIVPPVRIQLPGDGCWVRMLVKMGTRWPRAQDRVGAAVSRAEYLSHLRIAAVDAGSGEDLPQPVGVAVEVDRQTRPLSNRAWCAGRSGVTQWRTEESRWPA